MKTLEDLYKYTKDKNIRLKNFIDKENKINGMCLYNKNKCNIYMNTNINNEIEEKCVLAEEIGHYEKGIIQTKLNDTGDESTLIRSINEFRAKKWAIHEIIPFETFKSYLGTNKSKFEVANELEVTEEFIDMAYFIYEPLLYS